MTTIKLYAEDQKLCIVAEPTLASGDKKSVEIHFDFSAEWNGYTKSAVFFTDCDRTVYEVLLTNGKCIVPHEVLQFPGVMNVGARGVNPYSEKTSNLIRYRVEKGAPVGTGTAAEPTPDIYQQILAKISEAPTEAPPIVCEASGSVIAVNDSADRAVPGLRIYGKTIQDGTPTPEAPAELVSAGADGEIGVTVAGKNLADIDDMCNANLVANGDGSYTLTRNDGSGGRFSGYFNFGYLPAGTVLTVSAEVSGRISGQILYGGRTYAALQADMNGAHTATLPESTQYEMRIYHNSNEEIGTKSIIRNLQVELGDTATSYEPYKATQTMTVPHTLPGIPVSSGGNYTDENGQQWVTDEIDLARGVYVQRVWKRTFDGTETYVQHSFTTDTLFVAYCSSHEVTNYIRGTDRCDRFVAGSPNVHGNFTVTSGATNPNGNAHFAVSASALSENSVAGLKQWLAENRPTVICGMSVPIEEPLTAEEMEAFYALHTNKPNTTAFNDSGAGMELEYVADTKTYIDKKFAELATAILNNA